MLKAMVADCIFESVTWTVKLELPEAVGVPEITPVSLLSDRPVGSEPLTIDQVYGGVPPLTANVVE